MSNLLNAISDSQESKINTATIGWFKKLIQIEQYVGEVYSIGYESALVQIHDYHRQQVGGIPSLSFLIATRVNLENSKVDFTTEDASIILLRVMDSSALPNSAEAERIRVENAQRVSGTSQNWDESGVMDPNTANYLSFAGVKCRVIGTFFLDNTKNPDHLILRFGSDLSNYYPNRGLKVYKPNGNSLKMIVNYKDPDRISDLESNYEVTLGEIRYASTNRAFQDISNVEVTIHPADLLGQKSALFGMTRSGKSNSTKIIAKSVFELRYDAKKPLSIGQVIFDPNGEYANENVQDNNNALKNIWKTNKQGQKTDVVTYGILKHPNDPERRLMLLNFYADSNIQTGKDIIDTILLNDTSKYIQNFRQVVFEPPSKEDWSATTRYKRRLLAYRALLVKAGFPVPSNIKPLTKGLFAKELLDNMKKIPNTNSNAADYIAAVNVFSSETPSWDQIEMAFENLYKFIEQEQEYKDFESWYMNEKQGATGDKWADEDLNRILHLFKYPNGPRQIGKARPQHSPSTTTDYTNEIYQDLISGKLVIVDQSSGDPEINKSSAERIMWYIFKQNQQKFREGNPPPEILIYTEEAHNLLPTGSELDLKNVWVRTAKEGAKYHLGMIYATQEVSSIQKNILKNTSNWFIGHLNNTDETKELCKYYDFADFEPSIRRAQDRGFLRVKTLSNLFVIPVQVKLFQI